jgi:hypothetical protein
MPRARHSSAVMTPPSGIALPGCPWPAQLRLQPPASPSSQPREEGVAVERCLHKHQPPYGAGEVSHGPCSWNPLAGCVAQTSPPGPRGRACATPWSRVGGRRHLATSSNSMFLASTTLQTACWVEEVGEASERVPAVSVHTDNPRRLTGMATRRGQGCQTRVTPAH